MHNRWFLRNRGFWEGTRLKLSRLTPIHHLRIFWTYQNTLLWILKIILSLFPSLFLNTLHRNQNRWLLFDIISNCSIIFLPNLTLFIPKNQAIHQWFQDFLRRSYRYWCYRCQSRIGICAATTRTSRLPLPFQRFRTNCIPARIDDEEHYLLSKKTNNPPHRVHHHSPSPSLRSAQNSMAKTII